MRRADTRCGSTEQPEGPPSVLYTGRLAPEKGVAELAEATRGMRTVIAGDGPLRPLAPEALGSVSAARLSGLYGRAAIVACPSRREGFGIVCAEAMAHARPVVASAAGGLLDLVVHGETGYPVPPVTQPLCARASEAARRAGAAPAARAHRLRAHRLSVLMAACSGPTAQVYERALEQPLVRPGDLAAVE